MAGDGQDRAVRLGIGLKIGLFASALVLATGVLLGWRFRQAAVDVGLEHEVHELSLDPTAEKQLLLEAAADRVRARFGESALMPAALASPSA